MLTLVTGRRVECGDALIKMASDNASAQPAILIVPEQNSHEAERMLCAVGGDGVAMRAEVLSFSRLASRVFSVWGGLSRPCLDAGGRLLTMQRAVNEVRSRLKVYAAPVRRAKMLTQLLAAVDELKSYRVSAEKLSELSGRVSGTLKGKLEDISLISASYDAICARGEMDPKDRLEHLADGLEESGFACGRVFLIDGFTDFSEQELEIISVLLRRADSLTISVPCPELEGEEGSYSAERETARRLRAMADSCGSKIRVIPAPRQERPWALEYIDENLFKSAAAPFDGSIDHALELHRSGDRLGQCQWAAYRVLLAVSQGMRYRDIGVILGDEAGSAGLIQKVFDFCGIPVFLSEKTDILKKPLMSAICSALDCVTGGFEYEDVFRYLKTGLAGISPNDCDRLENYVIKWSIRGKTWYDGRPWTQHPDGYGFELDDGAKRRLERLNALRNKAAAPLFELWEGLKDAKNVAGQVEAVYSFSEALELRKQLSLRASQLEKDGMLQEADEYSQLWEIFCGCLEQCHGALGDTVMSADEFSRLLQLQIAQYSVGSIPVTLDSVTVCAAERMRGARKKLLLVLDAVDGAFPSLSGAAGLLTESERTELAALGLHIAPASEDRLDRQLGVIRNALSGASEELIFSYPALSDGGGENRPSFLLLRLKKLFPLLETDEFQPELTSIMAGTREKRGGGEPKLSARTVSLLYGDTIKLSASRADSLASCPFRFFMQYGLKAKLRQAEEFDAPAYGSLVHFVLEKVLRELSGGGRLNELLEISPLELNERCDAYARQYAKSALGGLDGKSARFLYLFDRTQKALHIIAQDAVAEVRQSKFKPLSFELPFGGKNGEAPAITYKLGDKTLEVVGIVDRVDGYKDGDRLYLRIVDYKTGAKSFDLKEIKNGIGIQMLIYLFELTRQNGKYFGEYSVVPAGVMYHPARQVILDVPRALVGSDLSAMRDKELKKSGLLLKNKEILDAMCGDGPRVFLPLTKNKDGEYKGSLAEAGQLQSLSRYVDGCLTRLGAKLEDGLVRPEPRVFTPSLSACTYCDFKDACHMGAGGPRCYMSSISAEDFWSAISKDKPEDVDLSDRITEVQDGKV